MVKSHFIFVSSITLMSLAPVLAVASSATSPLTEQIPVSMTVSPGCVVIGSAGNQVSENGQQIMALNFSGDNLTQTAQDKFTIQCTSGTTPTITVNDGKTNWAMAKDGNTSLPYQLSTDIDGKNTINPGGQLTISNNGDVNLYAKATIPANATTGTYNDTINATISW